MSRDVLAIFKLFFSRVYKAARFFYSFIECSSVEIVECSKKALLCSDFCDRNQVIILVVIVLLSVTTSYEVSLWDTEAAETDV